MHHKMGALFIHFVTFNSIIVVCLVSGVRIIFLLWGGRVPTPSGNW